jgi:hypothetical protein
MTFSVNSYYFLYVVVLAEGGRDVIRARAHMQIIQSSSLILKERYPCRAHRFYLLRDICAVVTRVAFMIEVVPRPKLNSQPME